MLYKRKELLQTRTTSLIVLILATFALSACSEETIIIEEDAVTNLSFTEEEISAVVDEIILPETESTYGSLGALSDTEYTLEEMLIYAIQDEYAARAEYDYILNTFDIEKPFSNIIKSEETHISLLLPLFTEFDIQVPDDTSSEHLIEINDLGETFATGVIAEEYNIAMYDAFLSQELPDSVREVFIKLRDASMNHLNAFIKNAEKY
jgi:hypothetical protein